MPMRVAGDPQEQERGELTEEAPSSHSPAILLFLSPPPPSKRRFGVSGVEVFADILVQRLIPSVPHPFLPLGGAANIVKNLAAVTLTSTCTPIYKAFAKGENIGDVTAKGERVGNIADLVCLSNFSFYFYRMISIFGMRDRSSKEELCVAYSNSQILPPPPSKRRFGVSGVEVFADILVQRLIPSVPHPFLPLGGAANIVKNLAAVTLTSTCTPIYKAFAKGENIGDVTAKGERVGNIADLVCLSNFSFYFYRMISIFGMRDRSSKEELCVAYSNSQILAWWGPSGLFLSDLGPTLEMEIPGFGTYSRRRILLDSDTPHGPTNIGPMTVR
nr:protein root uvb sensitive 6 [Quercus suber]